MRQTMVLLSTALLGLSLFAGSATAQEGTLSGRVTARGVPAAGVRVTVEGTEQGTLTDGRGLYLIPGLPAGTHTVRAEGLGYVSTETTVEIPAGGSVVHNFVVEEDALQLEQVTVTVGSRSRVTAAEELAVPVDVYTRADIIEASPQLEMASVLEELSPAVYFPRPQIADLTSGVRPFQLRGLSPDHSLVLINGKRRHSTAVVHVFGAASGGSGSSGVDMNAIVPSAQSGMEILRDGAAAQYGSDAIAGVINLQLRSDIHQPEFQASLGQYTPREPFERDGTRIELSGSSGLALGDRGSLVVSGMFSDRAKTDRAGPDPRDQIVEGDGDIIEEVENGVNRLTQKNNSVKQPSHLVGDGESTNAGAFLNMNYAVGENRLHEIYGFGGYSWRRDLHSGYFRRSIQAQNWPEIYPEGFLPSFRGDTRDLMAVVGYRGPIGRWTFDLSTQWNRNLLDTDIFNSNNVSLGPCLEGRDAPCAPGPADGWPDGAPLANKTDFFAGSLKLNQSITSFDVVREVQVGLASPLNVALGTAFRADNFQLIAGEPASWINGGHLDRNGDVAQPGSQVFAGYRPEHEANEWRSNIGLYGDLEADVTERLRLAVATRFENYSDFGSTLTGKLAARVQAADQFILRGAASTGFRAPNLNQSYYAHVSTGFRTDTITGDQVPYQIGELPVESAEIRALGAEPLKEETSVNLSAGLAWSPFDNLTLTVDGYQIDVDDRIILTGSLSGGIVEELLADFGAPTVKFFTNSIDTRTRGLDVSARYRHMLGSDRFVEVLGQYNRNSLTIRGVHVPAVIDEIRDQVFDSGDQYTLERGRPRGRGVGRFRYAQNRLQMTLSANVYGTQTYRLEEYQLGGLPELCAIGYPGASCIATTGPEGPGFDVFLENGPHLVFDANVSYEIQDGLSIAVGAENLTNKAPVVRPPGYDFNGIFPYYTSSGLSVNGRYVYTRLRVAF